ncbi:hypothetical protein ACFQ1I_37880 [Kitasatospora arboriphila]
MEEEPFGGHGEQRPGPEEQGGELACLLALLCPSCDAVPERPAAPAAGAAARTCADAPNPRKAPRPARSGFRLP